MNLARSLPPVFISVCLLSVASLLGVSPIQAAPTAGHQGLTIGFTRLSSTLRYGNVFTMNGQGHVQHRVTNHGTSEMDSYSWSPDGRYLLLERLIFPSGSRAGRDVLQLRNPTGKFIRRLATTAYNPTLPASWAVDRDKIAYVSKAHYAHSTFIVTVDSVDLTGHSSFLFRFRSRGYEGCGGGGLYGAAGAYVTETGWEGVAPTLQWDASKHSAIFSTGCVAVGLDSVNTKTQAVHALQDGTQVLSEGRMTRHGAIVAVSDLSQPYPDPTAKVIVGALGQNHWSDIGRGELPVWSRDGRKIFFTQETKVGTAGCKKNPAFASRIYRVAANGSQLKSLLLQRAYAFGTVQPLPNGAGLVFTRIGNDRHCPQATNNYVTGATVAIEKLTFGHSPVTLQHFAGLPAVRP